MNKIEEIIFKQINNVTHSLKMLDYKKINKVVETINNCEGYLFFTGIGKNGHVAAKASSTFASLGIKSLYLNSVDAVHGDMGNLTKKDIVFNVSKSGNTEELVNFLLNLKENNPEVKIISLHSNNNGKTKLLADLDIYIPDIKEIDMFDIVPTTSISAYTILLQSLGIHLSNISNFSLKKFKKNHPGGSIGKKLKNEQY